MDICHVMLLPGPFGLSNKDRLKMNAIFVVKEGSLLVFSDRSLEYLSSEPISYCDCTIKERIKSVNSFCFIFYKHLNFFKIN